VAAIVPRADAQPAAPAPAPRIESAARTFAAAIHRAVTADAPEAPTATAAPATLAPAVLPTHAAAPIDMTHAHWPAKMIERIEVLRDLADAQDTSIRLVPDALGAIDVSLRRDGDTVQVHMTAEQPQTRQLLAEAAPKLAELAEQRGLKLQQATAEAGGNAGGQQAPHRQQQQPQAPAPAPRRAAADASTPDDDARVA
jgi:Meckel syndrome type 1 protein